MAIEWNLYFSSLFASAVILTSEGFSIHATNYFRFAKYSFAQAAPSLL
jgi:hypothetical protein